MIGLVFAGQMDGVSIHNGKTAWQNIEALAEEARKYQEKYDLDVNPVVLNKWKQTTGKVSLVNSLQLGDKQCLINNYIDLTNKNQRSIWDMPNSDVKKVVMKNSDQNVLIVAPTSHNKAMVNYNLDLIWLKNSLLFFAAGAGLFAGAHAAKSAGYSKDLVNPMSMLGATLGFAGLSSSLFSYRGKYSKFNCPNDNRFVIVENEAVVKSDIDEEAVIYL